MNHLISLNVLQLNQPPHHKWSLTTLLNRSVAASIHSRKHVWLQLFPEDMFIKDLVPHRLRLPLKKWPIQRLTPTPPKPSETVDKEVEKLLGMKAAGKINRPKKGLHFVQRMFDIPKKRSPTGERRPILDCRPLNRFLHTSHFKMEGLNTVRELLQKGDWMTSIDLKSAYLQVGIRKCYQPLLTFQWKKLFVYFTTLPFGLNIAPRTFTKLMRRAVQIVRQMGVRIIYYLDDTLLLARSREEAVRQTALWALILTELGFVINWEKSQLTPTQKTIFLGVEIDSLHMSFALPEEKLQRILQICQLLIDNPVSKQYTARQLASYLGTLNSTSECFAPCKMFTHFIHKDLMKALKKGWTRGMISLSVEAKEECRWWQEHLLQFNGQPISKTLTATFQLQTDASGLGWGGVLFQPDHYQTYMQGQWSKIQTTASNNVREMTAVVLSLKEVLPKLARDTPIDQRTLLIESDNTTTVQTLLRRGSTKTTLNDLAKQVWQMTRDYQFRLQAVYLPGVENQIADGLSRTYHSSLAESRLNRVVFHHIDQKFGPLSIDLFASGSNHQLQKFVTWKYHSRAWRIDAFSLVWTQLRGLYLFPPCALIAKALNKVMQERAPVVIVTPIWPAQPWWPLLLNLAIALPILLPSLPDLFMDQKGRHQNPGWNSAAWLISGRNSQDGVSPLMQLIQSSSPGKILETMTLLGTFGACIAPKVDTVSNVLTLLQKQILFLK